MYLCVSSGQKRQAQTETERQRVRPLSSVSQPVRQCSGVSVKKGTKKGAKQSKSTDMTRGLAIL